jgi:conjugal transfer/entry exclusion protein
MENDFAIKKKNLEK